LLHVLAEIHVCIAEWNALLVPSYLVKT